MLHNIVENFSLVGLAGFFKHPAVAFLNEVIGVGEKGIGDEKDIVEEFTVTGR